MPRIRSLLLLSLVILQVVAMAAAPADAGGRGREFRIPTPSSYPHRHHDRPGREPVVHRALGQQDRPGTTSGVFTEFPIPTPPSDPRGIIAGPDANLWFVEAIGNKFGYIRPTSGEPA